jgi:chemotaxis signal transduction protein
VSESAITGRDEAKSSPESADSDFKTQYILFVVGGSLFAINLPLVEKILEPEWWVRIPHAAKWVEGVLYHHGDALTVLNAGTLLEREPTMCSSTAAVLRLNVPKMKVGILVDRVLGTWRSTTPVTACKGASFVKGVWDRKGRMINLLSLDSVLDRACQVFDA